jgi:hypothetical protein
VFSAVADHEREPGEACDAFVCDPAELGHLDGDSHSGDLCDGGNAEKDVEASLEDRISGEHFVQRGVDGGELTFDLADAQRGLTFTQRRATSSSFI